MLGFRINIRTLAALTLLGGLAQVGAAAVTVEQVLAYKPAQPGVEITTPASGEVASCTIDLEKGQMLANGKQATAWVVKDAKGNILRKFHDTTGAGGVNMFAYFRDGEEVYREIDTNGNNKVDQYRWLGSAGSKWGMDADEDGKIDTWLAISAEELSQELLAAVVKKDAKRLEALMITQADLNTLGLPQAEVNRITAKVGGAGAQFQKTCKELAGLKDSTIWVHLETKLPQTVAADSLGAKTDLVRYRHATILYQEGDGKDAKHNWLQTGELIQVGRAWRIIQGPTTGMNPEPDQRVGGPDPSGVPIPAGAEEFLKQLEEHDRKGPSGQSRDGIVAFNIGRARILEQIAALYKKVEDGPKRDVWLRQVADCYAAAAQQGDKAALKRLGEWKAALAADPKSPALAYFAFREISSDYAHKLPNATKAEDLTKLQEEWKTKLAGYIKDFPTSEDAPDAVFQLGTVNEFFGPKAEDEAKAAYNSVVKNFPGHVLAKRAQGCLERLSLEGKAMNLTSPTLDGGRQVNVASLGGKAVVVYYWASWNEMAQSDFKKIKEAVKDFAGKAEVVGVNLDSKPEDAMNFVKANPMPATHLFMPGGLDSPLAVQYGVTALPVMFLVGPDGKVVSRNLQASTLDDELKKLFKAPEKDK
jgi:thiol-disulfide isomerase/thioredoxin